MAALALLGWLVVGQQYTSWSRQMLGNIYHVNQADTGSKDPAWRVPGVSYLNQDRRHRTSDEAFKRNDVVRGKVGALNSLTGFQVSVAEPFLRERDSSAGLRGTRRAHAGVRLFVDASQRPEGKASSPYGNSGQQEIGGRFGRDPRAKRINQFIVRIAVGIFGLWWGAERILRGGRLNERLGGLGLAVGFVALLFPW